MVERGHESMEFWLGRLRPSTIVVNRYHFNRFMKWLRENGGRFSDFTPDQLVEFQANATGRDRYQILDYIQKFVGSIEGRHGYKVKTYSTVRSFFNHNRCELPRDSTFSVNGDTPKVVGTLRPEEVRDMVLSSNPVFRAAFICMIQGGIDRESFTWWNNNGWPALEKALRGNPEAVRVNLPGRKKARNVRPYYTFIGSDAIEAIRKWMSLRPEGASAIFVDQLGNPVSSHALKQYWDRHLVKLGMIEKVSTRKARGGWVRYGKSPHEMRDVFRTLWEKSPANKSVAEFLMGHEVDPLEYNKAFQDEAWAKREYMKALPFLQIISSGRPFGQVEEEEIDLLKGENLSLKQQLEALRLENLDMRSGFEKLQQRDLEGMSLIEKIQAELAELRKAVEDKGRP